MGGNQSTSSMTNSILIISSLSVVDIVTSGLLPSIILDYPDIDFTHLSILRKNLRQYLGP